MPLQNREIIYRDQKKSEDQVIHFKSEGLKYFFSKQLRRKTTTIEIFTYSIDPS